MVIAPSNIIQYYCEYGQMVLVLLLDWCSNDSPPAFFGVTREVQIIQTHVL